MLNLLHSWLSRPLPLGNTSLLELLEPVFYITTHEKRIFWGYLFITAIITAILYFYRGQSIKSGIQFLLSKKLWLHPSVLLDFKLVLLNNWLWVLLIAPLLTSQVAIAIQTNRSLKSLFGRGDFIDSHLYAISIIYTLIIFIIDDFSRFYLHRLYHRIPLLWRFHAVHHSATLLTPFTLYRIHIVEMFINACRSVLVFGLIGGVVIYLVDGKISEVQILGTSVFSLLFNLAGSNLRHSHVWLGWGRFERFILSPAQHQIHHSASPEHYDRNFGVMIAIWDRWFNSWMPSKEQHVERFGLGSQKVKQNLKQHFIGIG